jgi:flagellar export protein FliJ
MGFRFRFETLSRVRKIREDLALQDFSKTQQVLLNLENLKAAILLRRDSVWQNLTEKMESGITAQDIISYNNYLFYLEAGITQTERQIAQALKLLETKRQELLKTKKEAKAIERLREIDMERHTAEQARQEMDFINEIAIQRHGRI